MTDRERYDALLAGTLVASPQEGRELRARMYPNSRFAQVQRLTNGEITSYRYRRLIQGKEA